MIVSGTVTIKMAPMLKRIYDQMPDPKWAVSMGSCANSGGPVRHGYHVVKRVDRVMPADVYAAGGPESEGGWIPEPGIAPGRRSKRVHCFRSASARPPAETARRCPSRFRP